MSGREVQHAEPTPSLTAKQSQDLSFLEELINGESQYSSDSFYNKNEDDNFYKIPKKTQKITKEHTRRKNSMKDGTSRESTQKKVIRLQNRIKQLQVQLKKMQTKSERCPHCLRNLINIEQKRQNNFRPIYDEQLIKVVNSLDSSRGSRGSMQFQKVDFTSMPMINRQMDDKGWIFLGTMMIAMGSKCMDIDGTINVFKILKEAVDNLRKQVDKSMPNISMDFYLCKEQMQQNLIPQQMGFDPFMQKTLTSGLLLEGLKIESVYEFQLFYENKMTYNIKYESLLTAMEHVREGCWISSP